MVSKELGLLDKQKVSLEILQYVASFCEKHSIRYYLAYGTLLGAIRHSGFIPWDDDVDLFIPRPDYNRLLQEFDNSEPYELLSCFNTRDYVMPFSKVQNIKTAMQLPSGRIINHGLGIDLFPIDGIPNEYDLNDAENVFKKENDVFVNTVQKIDTFKFLAPRSAKEYAKMIAYQASIITGILNKKCRSISANPYDSDYDNCCRVASVVGIHSGVFRPFKKEWFKPMSVGFEGLHFIAPSGYDEILSMIYPNYMQLPPKEKQVTTHIAKYIWL